MQAGATRAAARTIYSGAEMTNQTRGPASYFPSIEKKHGQPVQHWLGLLEALPPMKHMEMVNWLKDEHAFGHGHANALVAHHLQSAGAA
jgi:hypothetical protein